MMYEYMYVYDLFLIVCLSPHCSVNGLQCICLCDRDGVQIVEGINPLLSRNITYHVYKPNLWDVSVP